MAELQHYGTKGMKWGVRRADKKFEKRTSSLKTKFKIYNEAASRTNKVDVDRINNKPQYKGKDFSKDSPLRQKYYKEHSDALVKNLEKVANEQVNASGTKQYTILVHPDGNSWSVRSKDVKHAEDDDDELIIKVKRDALGHILSLSESDDFEHAMSYDDEHFEHYGIKGMKWGVRRAEPSRTYDSAGNTTAAVGGRIREVKLGPKVRESADASDDAARSAVLKKRASTKSTDSLSNKELQDLVTRMNLEQQYSRLSNPQGNNSAKKMITDILVQEGRKELTKFVQNQAMNQVGNLLKKR